MEEQDLYAVLEVDRDADQEQIRRAYRLLLRRHHPDLQLSADPETARAAARTMARILDAYTVLGDPRRRAAYDNRGQHRAASVPDARPRSRARHVALDVQDSEPVILGWTALPEDTVWLFPPVSPLRPPRDVFDLLVRRWFLG
ncbi:DnaJ domain-containing protein [Crystallibacter degradans]|uniref:DnaJ domain-containing protein n=1 Tax=Crystallibacter degradans TaxID=2726743 RepID=UPI001473358E|nr:DnaJ domain-containing protein [Arthrobacter sp. SF27]NMR28748.1 DnaJ domain-containing protein [Arthrobacter sp. SF27]